MTERVCYQRGVVVERNLVVVPDTVSTEGALFFLEEKACAAFVEMRTRAKKEGIGLVINNAWRSMEHQRRLYNKWKAGELNASEVASPGYSNHQNGICVDISTFGEGRESPVFKWLDGMAAMFNFYNTVRSEPWHWQHEPKAEHRG